MYEAYVFVSKFENLNEHCIVLKKINDITIVSLTIFNFFLS